ncbi:MAG TPA: hypothetical protein VF129_14605 [Actinomycetota bacterium]
MWLPSIALVAALLLGPVDPSFAPAPPGSGTTTWFVRADAPPGGTGGRSDPFETVQEGIHAARPGTGWTWGGAPIGASSTRSVPASGALGSFWWAATR